MRKSTEKYTIQLYKTLINQNENVINNQFKIIEIVIVIENVQFYRVY